MSFLYLFVGIKHFLNPSFFEAIVPPFFVYKGALVYISGFIEIAPPYERSISGLEVMELVTNSTKDIPGIIVETKKISTHFITFHYFS